MAKRVLVTGGAGYIGSYACEIFSKLGYEPVVYDNLVYGHKEFVKWGPFEHGDLLDINKLDSVVKYYKPEAVIHFAAFTYVGESVTNPSKYYKNNVLGAMNILDVMLKNNIKKIIFSSSCAVYGYPEEVPITECANQNPINAYGKTKHIVEQMLNDYDRAYGLKSISLRYFNAAGADPECEIGEDHSPETHLIPLILDVALGRREGIVVMGDDYNTKDGTCIRDYIHVMDLANAHLLALKYLEEKNISQAYNLGNGTGCSVFGVISAAEKITGKIINKKIGKRRAGDPDCLIADASKIKNDIGWIAKYEDIETIIRHAWEWHKHRF